MGLDIMIGVNNYDEVYSDEYTNEYDLSRTFCNLMCRHHVIDHETELNQIGRITGIDMSFSYQMENDPDSEGLEFLLEQAETEEERHRIIEEAKESKAALEGNIDYVLQSISSLIERLNLIPNFPELLIETDDDTLNNKEYFSDFHLDKGQDSINHNFGQDLRNFERFLGYAKSNGTNSVWFV